MSTHEAADLMSEHQVRRLPVVENERIVGIVSLGDLAVKEAKDRRIGDTLEHISEGVKERGLAVQLEPREQQQREHDQHDDDDGEARTAGPLEERSFRRRLDARLRRRVAAP